MWEGVHSCKNGYFRLASCYFLEDTCVSKKKGRRKKFGKCLTYRLVIGYQIVDQGKCFSPRDLSASSGMVMKTQKFFKILMFQKSLLNLIREYMGMVHTDYMNTIRMLGWRLDEHVELRSSLSLTKLKHYHHILMVRTGNIYTTGEKSGTMIQGKKHAVSFNKGQNIKAFLLSKNLWPNNMSLFQCHLFRQSFLLVRRRHTMPPKWLRFNQSLQNRVIISLMVH